jgi:hypothetical protein
MAKHKVSITDDNKKEVIKKKKATSGKGNLQMIKKTMHFALNFSKFPLFCVLFPSLCWNSTKPQHFTTCQYSAKQHSGIIYYISQQSHVMHPLVL